MTPIASSIQRKHPSQYTIPAQHICTTSTMHTVRASHTPISSNECLLTQHTTRNLIDRALSKEALEQLKNRIQHGSLDIREIQQANYDLIRNNVSKASIKSLFSKMQTAISCSRDMDNATKKVYTKAITQSCAESSFISSEHKAPSQRSALILRKIYDRTLPLNYVKESFKVLRQECSQQTALQYMRYLKRNLISNTKSDVERKQIQSFFNFSKKIYRTTTQRSSNSSIKDALIDQLLSCNFTPETGPQILQQLLDMGMSINTLRWIISRTRNALSLKYHSTVYDEMSNALYVSSKQQSLEQLELQTIKKSFRQGTISIENISTAIQQLLNAKESPDSICELLSRCKTKIKSSKNKPNEEKKGLIKELELSYQRTKQIQLQVLPQPLSYNTNEVTNTHLEGSDTENTSHALQDVLDIINAETIYTTKEVQTPYSQIVGTEQSPQIEDDILDLFLKRHELTLSQDTDLSTSNFEQPEASNTILYSQTNKIIHIEQSAMTSSQTPMIETINSQHNSHIVDMEQIPQISDDILDIFLKRNELIFLQDTPLSTSYFEQSETYNNIFSSQTHKTMHIERNELISLQAPLIGTINLPHVENGQIDPNLLVHAITILLKTTLPETLLHALSLYEVNHQYDPNNVSMPLSAAAQLIRSYNQLPTQQLNNTSQVQQ